MFGGSRTFLWKISDIPLEDLGHSFDVLQGGRFWTRCLEDLGHSFDVLLGHICLFLARDMVAFLLYGTVE